MKKFLIVFLISAYGFAQSSVNDYKYVIVPKKYEFLKEENKYRLNTLTKFMLEEGNFNAVYSDEMPADLRLDPCKGLKVDVINNSGLFTTKLNVVFKDCGDRVIFTSEEGKSKIKEYQGAYHEALKRAFVSVKALNYKYQPKEESVTVAAVPATPVTPAAKVEKPVVTEKEAVTPAVVNTEARVSKSALGTLYAQPIENGYQLVDMSPKVVMYLKATSQQHMYIAQKGSLSGTVYKDGSNWYFEFYKDGKLKKELLDIKF
ncbi:hypothetical protein [Zhouia amylolytica]|uniref:Secreted protein n=1 Tax=Zhouia amylolytica AD3 TaxID=1286632 RepID=W2URY2_9FLAO|nr:hypothetical protein [Zhouia amylolytica]ETN96719.1 hypothetical protein P278_01450 [Zhouia amylolytica AD3]